MKDQSSTIVKKLLLSLLVAFIAGAAAYAQKVTVSGYMNDSQSGECLIGAAAYDSLSARGCVSNNFGYYTLTLNRGPVELAFSYIGYEGLSLALNLRKDTVINVKLLPSRNYLQEAVVTASHGRMGVEGSQMSAIEVPVRQIKMVPAMFGEVDVIKALQLLPGVQSGSEGSAGLYVRGGGPDENLLLLDGVPLYGVNHLFGFFSVFNADAVKNVTLYKGSFPARFGSRLSSIVDIRTNDGNENECHGSASIGLIAAKFNVEGPIVKGKTTFSVSGRRTYVDAFVAPLAALYTRIESKGSNSATGGYYFYDFNAKVTHKFSDKDRLYLSFYTGKDNVYVQENNYTDDYGQNSTPVKTYYSEKTDVNWNWGNTVAALRWNHVFGPKLFANSSVSYTRYRHVLSADVNQSMWTSTIDKVGMDEKVKYSSGMGDIAANTEFEYKPAPQHDIKFGVQYVNHTFRPGVYAYAALSNESGVKAKQDTTFGNMNIHSNELAAYAEDDWDIADFLKVNAGARYSLYTVSGKTYHSFEPRVSLRVLLTEKLSVKASYAEMSQYVHLLSTSSISLPTDLWVPVTANIEPMRSNQTALGIFYELGMFDLSVEGYYKGMDNVIEYQDGASFLGSATSWESKVCVGRGWAYGVEFMAQKKIGSTTGWIAYTWSKAMRQFDREGNIINFGNPFYAKYDRRHDLSVTVAHTFNSRFDLSGTFVYASGNCGTLALQNYLIGSVDTSSPSFFDNYNQTGYISSRNNYRLPAYSRLDISFSHHRRFRKHPGWESVWNYSIYNVYNRMNPFVVYSSYDEVADRSGNLKYSPVLKQISLFPIIPSVTYTFKF